MALESFREFCNTEDRSGEDAKSRECQAPKEDLELATIVQACMLGIQFFLMSVNLHGKVCAKGDKDDEGSDLDSEPSNHDFQNIEINIASKN
jgi:hypothetical protein